MISFGSLELVVFIDQVNLNDLGFTWNISPDSLTTLEMVLLPPGVMVFLSMPMVWPWLPALPPPMERLPSIPVSVPSYRLLNLDDNLEKKDVLAAEFSAEVSCEERGTPYWLVGAGRLVCPEWKVDLAGTWRWKAAVPLLAPGDTAAIFRL